MAEYKRNNIWCNSSNSRITLIVCMIMTNLSEFFEMHLYSQVVFIAKKLILVDDSLLFNSPIYVTTKIY